MSNRGSSQRVLGLFAVLVLLAFPLSPAWGQSPELKELHARSSELFGQGRYAEAVPVAEQALELTGREYGADAQKTAIALIVLAMLHEKQGHYAEAVPYLKRALAIRERALGPDHPEVAGRLNNLAVLYNNLGHFTEAEPLYKRALEIREKAFGPNHPDTARSLGNLGFLYDNQGRYTEAESLYKRALAIREKTLGPEDPEVVANLDNLALLYRIQGRHAEAEPLYERTRRIREQTLGPEAPEVAVSLDGLAAVYKHQSRRAEAEALFKRALAIREKIPGPDGPEVATSINSLAMLYKEQGRYAEAEPLYKRALTIWENTLGADHPDTTASLNNLALLYSDQGRYAEAEPLLRHALTVREKTLGPDHPEVASSLNNLALLYDHQSRHGDAEPLYKRALAIFESALGPDHPHVATGLDNLAMLYHDQGRHAEAEPLLEKALAIREKIGPDHPEVATSLNNLALSYDGQGRHAEAEPLFRRALAILEPALGPDHPHVATSLNNLAWVYEAQGRINEALRVVRRATAIRGRRAARTSGTRSQGGRSEQTSHRNTFVNHVGILARQPEMTAVMRAEAFEVAQFARGSDAASAVARMAARFAVGDDALAKVVRARQDAVERWQRLDIARVKAASEPPAKRDPAVRNQLLREMADLDGTLSSLDETLARRFPEYAELVAPKPVSLSGASELLAVDEALVTFLVGEEESYVWVVRPDRESFHTLAIGREALSTGVAILRGHLDPSGLSPPGRGARRGKKRVASIYDLDLAFDLYRRLLAPAEPLLADARHVFVVPDGSLTGLPLGVLVTDRPQAPIKDFVGLQKVPWLARRYALTTLPSVSALRALHRFERTARAGRPFTGIGDPVLGGSSGRARGGSLLALFARGTVADVAAVRDLAPLPETADELRQVAELLGAGEADLHLRYAATEDRIKALDLSNSRVLHFATHALVAGEIEGVIEPALVLTPPAKGSARDDGLLTASEVAQLKLNADWVILSACNTAAGDGTPGAEGLSGLAKAFFHAGSRALLVSHWPVHSDAAVRLTTGMFVARRNDPNLGRAEALRQSMLALMKDPARPHYAHPKYWAPFVVVGEGR